MQFCARAAEAAAHNTVTAIIVLRDIPNLSVSEPMVSPPSPQAHHHGLANLYHTGRPEKFAKRLRARPSIRSLCNSTSAHRSSGRRNKDFVLPIDSVSRRSDLLNVRARPARAGAFAPARVRTDCDVGRVSRVGLCRPRESGRHAPAQGRMLQQLARSTEDHHLDLGISRVRHASSAGQAFSMWWPKNCE
jgi:hypothetical protein